LSSGARLSDYLSASLLARVYPSELIEQVLEEQNLNSQRVRRLPASVMVYYCMVLSLYPEAAYASVFAVAAPKQAPALELAQLYQDRWEVEAVFDELKTSLPLNPRPEIYVNS